MNRYKQYDDIEHKSNKKRKTMVKNLFGIDFLVKYGQHVKINHWPVQKRKTSVQFFKQICIIINKNQRDFVEEMAKNHSKKHAQIKILLLEFFIKKN